MVAARDGADAQRLATEVPLRVAILGFNMPRGMARVNGYRVRLRVVEGHDVALLAESPEDAKAQAQVKVRAGAAFEAIQDSWPEEIVSVEAIAVEPYPGLE